MADRLADRVAIITGGAKGIGLACGSVMARQGAKAVAKSFGSAVPPRVSLSLESKSSHTRKAAKLIAAVGAKAGRMKQGSGHSFSAANPGGKRAAGDSRQFARI